MGPRGGEQLVVAAQGQRDPIFHCQPGRLTRALDGVDDLAGQALPAQIVVDRQIEGDGRVALTALGDPAGVRSRLEAEGVAFDEQDRVSQDLRVRPERVAPEEDVAA